MKNIAHKKTDAPSFLDRINMTVVERCYYVIIALLVAAQIISVVCLYPGALHDWLYIGFAVPCLCAFYYLLYRFYPKEGDDNLESCSSSIKADILFIQIASVILSGFLLALVINVGMGLKGGYTREDYDSQVARIHKLALKQLAEQGPPKKMTLKEFKALIADINKPVHANKGESSDVYYSTCPGPGCIDPFSTENPLKKIKKVKQENSNLQAAKKINAHKAKQQNNKEKKDVGLK